MITGLLFLFEMLKCFETPAWMQIRAYVTSRWAFPVIYSDLSVFAPLKRPAYVMHVCVLSVCLSVCHSFVRSVCISLYHSIYCHVFVLSFILYICRSIFVILCVCLSLCHLWKSCTAILTLQACAIFSPNQLKRKLRPTADSKDIIWLYKSQC